MTEVKTYRERKKERIRETIAQSAWRLFQEQGFDTTTIDQIAEESGISRRTYFRYFPTKESVVFPRRLERLELFKDLLAQEDGARGVYAVRRAVMTLARVFAENADELLTQHQLVMTSSRLQLEELQVDADWEKAISETLTAHMDPDSNEARRARMLAGAVSGIIRAGLNEWFATDGQVELPELAGQALDLVLPADPEEEGAT